jgi:hypothetical protein
LLISRSSSTTMIFLLLPFFSFFTGSPPETTGSPCYLSMENFGNVSNTEKPQETQPKLVETEE